MKESVRRLVGQITELEDQLRELLHKREPPVSFELDGAKVRFTREALSEHRRLRIGLFRWLRGSDLKNALTAPFIYGMFFPMVIFDLSLTVYQTVCFPLYRLRKVRRWRYIALDRRHLAYLNSLEKLNCAYCGYANGLLSYAVEIVSRTEQYWCPIKHAHKMLGSHKRYSRFLDYGDANDYPENLEKLREDLRSENA